MKGANHRRRHWRVTFGNPALGTYVGYIVTIHLRSRSCSRQRVDDAENGYYSDGSASSMESFTSSSSTGSSDQDGEKSQRIAVMVNVPPYHVPDGVLNLIRGHRPFIEHVRIVISSSRKEEAKYRCQRRNLRANKGPTNQNLVFEARRSRSQTWAYENEWICGSNIEDDDQRASSNAEQNECDNLNMTRVSRSTSLDFSSIFLHANAHEIQNTTGSTEELYSVVETDSDCEGDKKYHILFILDSDESAKAFVSDLHHRPYTTLDESERCSVYHASHVRGENGVSLLGPFFASSTPSPNETSPSSAKDEHKCPVCLEVMVISSKSSILDPPPDSSCSILTTVCNHSFHIDCLSQWQDSPCPVCRYDHSGLNETLSRCHVCANTVRNYVCLICGVISCANGPSSSSTTIAHLTMRESADHPTFQAPSHLGHALQHYEESLHAYALDTETQHVWDFVGGGYVHRLLQNFEDGKIVEGIDPRFLEEERSQNLLNEGTGEGPTLPLSALERSTIPTYSSEAEDDEAVHRKLEGFAGQYYILLKSQLEQQRIYYEGQLEAIRRQNEITTRAVRPSASDIISALKQERNHLDQRCMTLRRKHKKVADDLVFLQNMNKSLEDDREVFRRKITDAQNELADATQLTQRLLTPLEEKVSLLIHQLENGILGGAENETKLPSALR